MSLNETLEPILVKIAPNSTNWQGVGLVLIIMFFGLLLFYAFYKPRNIGFKICKKPNGTYQLKYYWGWHNFSAYYNQNFETKEAMQAEINKIIDKTEWKPD